LADATFHQLLLACDRDLADTVRGAGCKRCSGVVHCAHYWRKPRGRPCRLGREHDQRFSFCCAVDGCRSRATPPSLRFLGPKVYIAAIMVLIAILLHGATARRMREGQTSATALCFERLLPDLPVACPYRSLGHKRYRQHA
jgi:hypothetical protein